MLSVGLTLQWAHSAQKTVLCSHVQRYLSSVDHVFLYILLLVERISTFPSSTVYRYSIGAASCLFDVKLWKGGSTWVVEKIRVPKASNGSISTRIGALSCDLSNFQRRRRVPKYFWQQAVMAMRSTIRKRSANPMRTGPPWPKPGFCAAGGPSIQPLYCTHTRNLDFE